ncbi:MAG: nucleotidyltransferase family protein [Caldisericia bacterium]|jgi:molybdenum cofactor cytidylyltransferase|nr:nucleotidyltransferase family protein [Caldisericia bacterium]
MKIFGIVISAGEGRRMEGRIKQLLPWKNSTILGTIIETLKDSELDKIYIILGYEKEIIYNSIKDLLTDKFEVIINENYKKGMVTSIQEALKKAHTGFDGFIVFLGDQPFLNKETVNTLINEAKKGEYPIIVSCYKGERGHPTYISMKFKEKILLLDPEKEGLRDIIYDARNKNLVLDLETGDPDTIKDIDTYEMYLKEKEEHNA